MSNLIVRSIFLTRTKKQLAFRGGKMEGNCSEHIIQSHSFILMRKGCQ